MAIKYSSDIKTATALTARTENPSYPVSNIEDKWRLRRHFRAMDSNTDDWLIKIDFGTSMSINGILINDVNFNKIKIEAHTSDSWTSPDYSSNEITISQNAITGRYQAFLDITFTKRWMRLYIPSGTTTIDNLSVWRMGTLCPLSTVTELSHNLAYPLTRTAKEFVRNIETASGGREKVKVGDYTRWQGDITFTRRSENDEGEVWTFNRNSQATPIVFFENRGTIADAYLCTKDDSYEGSLESYNNITANTIRLRELI